MLDPQLVATIQRVPLFARLPQYQIERIARIARVTRYDPGAVVFRQWEVARGFYMLLSGSGQLIQQGNDGGQRLLSVVQPNQFFNEGALTDEMVEQASFVITQPSLVLHIPRTDYRALPTHVPPNWNPERQTQHQSAPNPPTQQGSAPRQQGSPVQARPSAGAASNSAGGRATAAAPLPRDVPNRIVQGNRPSWLNPGETILLMTRRHWWAAFRRMWLAVLAFIGLLVVFAIVDNTVVRFAVLGLAIAVPGMLIVYFYFDWRNDWLVITDERVLRVEQIVARFSIETTEVGLLSVQAVLANLPPGDPFSRVLRYGNVEIRTAGGAGNITMDFVPHPSRIKDYVFRQREIKLAAAGGQPQPVPQPGAPRQNAGPRGTGGTPGTSSPGEDMRRSATAMRGGGLFTMRFRNDRGEMVYRRHLIVWARHIFWPLMFFFVSLFVLLASQSIPALVEAGPLVRFFALGGMIFSLVWLYLADWDWRNDLYIVGDQFITLLHRSPFFLQFREDQILVQRIHNIEAETTGLLRSLLDYGDVRLLLLGDETPRVFRDIPNPIQVREEISRRQRIATDAAQKAEEQRQLDAVMARMQEQGLVAPQAAPPNNTAQKQPTTPTNPQEEYRPPAQPQRPPIPRRRI